MIRTLRISLAVALVATALSACAYYNTLYNAKQQYREAAAMPKERDGTATRGQKEAYDRVIEKCQTMIGTYPNSRHVDDAMMLIARSLYGQQRYGETVAQLDSLEAKFPDTDRLHLARFLKGQALAEWGRHERAVEVLTDYNERWPGAGQRVESMYYLSTSLMELDRDDDAVAILNEMENRYGQSAFTFKAQLEAAQILAKRENYEDSRALYEELNSDRLPVAKRYEVWMGLSKVYIALGQSQEALEVLSNVETLALNAQTEPPVLLLKGDAYVGVDSLARGISTFKEVTSRFSRGEYAAEAHYRLGRLYESSDSLAAAKRHFDRVPRVYAKSPNAKDAIKRSGNISRLIRLEEATADNSPEAMAMRSFSMAEIQFFQFNNPERALELYSEVLTDHPDSEWAPKSAYAVAYIYAAVLNDSARAAESYRLLKTRYAGTVQAANADLILAVANVPVPVMPAVADTTGPPPIVIPAAAVAPDTTAEVSDTNETAVPDTTSAADVTNEATEPDTSSTDTEETKPAEDESE